MGYLENTYNKLNDILKVYNDKIFEEDEFKKRIDLLIGHYVNEIENYKNQIEENTIILQAQFEEISRLYEELTTVLDISKTIFSVKDPRLAVDSIINRLKNSVDFRNVIVGEFVNFSKKDITFNPIFLDLIDMEFQSIDPILKTFMNMENKRTLLREKDDINNKNTSFIMVPIQSKIKIWGFILLYGKKDNSFFLAADKKIMESVAEQLAFGFDTMDFLQDKIKQQKMNEQLKLAKQIQESLLPTKIPEFSDIKASAFYRSAYDVGGDYYDIIKVNDNTLFGLLADVSGKGVPAALIMSSVRAVIRSRIEGGDSIETLVKYINNYLAKNIPDSTFVTAIFILLNCKEKHVKIINAGHNPSPVFVDDKYIISSASSFPLGIVEDTEYSVEHYDYKNYFTFITYTDGITESRNSEGEEFEYKRLENLIKNIYKENTDLIVNRIIDTVDTFVNDAPQHDDTTMLVIKSY